MLTSWLNEYGPSNLEALLALLALGALVAAGWWVYRRQWQERARQAALALADAKRECEGLRGELDQERRTSVSDGLRHKQELDETRGRYDPDRIRAMQDHLQRVIAHEFVKGLHFIEAQCGEVTSGLGTERPDLRDRLNQARVKAYQMDRRAENIVRLGTLERDADGRELVNLRGLLEDVLTELFGFAEARGIHLQTRFGTLGPISANRLLIADMCSNVIHNGIRYSHPGGAVEIALRLECKGEQRAVVEVCDHGRGIDAKDQETIFEADVRGAGPVEPGTGLGLYHARRIARLHGGDLLLVESTINQGSTFRIILPYRQPDISSTQTHEYHENASASTGWASGAGGLTAGGA